MGADSWARRDLTHTRYPGPLASRGDAVSRALRRSFALCAASLSLACANGTQSALEDTRSQIATCMKLLADPSFEEAPGIGVCRSEVAANRRTIVARNLTLDGAEEAAFWRLYDAYHAEVRSFDDRLAKLIETFALEQDDPEGAFVMPMIEEAISIREGRLAVLGRYMESLGEVLSPSTLLRYFQIETRLDAMVAYELARHTALAR